MTKITKTTLYDATFSWNGYNYQGKIGLYVVLTNLLKNSTKATFNDYINQHSIEYEWAEDFSIKNGKSYVSQHQVKHIDSKNFSSYKDAIKTIISRKKGILPRDDLKKYVNKGCRGDDKLDNSTCVKLIDELKTHMLLDVNCQIVDDWESHLNLIDKRYQEAIKLCFTEFKGLLNKMEDCSIYLHTSKELDEPNQDTKDELFEGKQHLNSNDIYYYSQYSNTKNDYSLALSDSNLDILLIKLTTKLLSHLHPSVQYLANDKTVYVSSLKSLIDNHISIRHANISNSISSNGFSTTKPLLGFNEIITILKKNYRVQDNEYWNLICRNNFEVTYLDYRKKLLDRLKNNPDENYISKLDQFKKIINNHYQTKFRKLIQELSLHICEKSEEINFYIEACSKKDMQNLYFNFLIRITNQIIDSSIRFKVNDQILYHFSCIDFTEYDLVNTTEILINEAKVGLKANSQRNAGFLHNVDYIISKIGNSSQPIDTQLEKITEGKKIPSHNDIDENHKYTVNKRIYFIDSEEALEKING